jgi:hypothetical protein
VIRPRTEAPNIPAKWMDLGLLVLLTGLVEGIPI